MSVLAREQQLTSGVMFQEALDHSGSSLAHPSSHHDDCTNFSSSESVSSGDIMEYLQPLTSAVKRLLALSHLRHY